MYIFIYSKSEKDTIIFKIEVTSGKKGKKYDQGGVHKGL